MGTRDKEENVVIAHESDKHPHIFKAKWKKNK